MGTIWEGDEWKTTINTTNLYLVMPFGLTTWCFPGVVNDLLFVFSSYLGDILIFFRVDSGACDTCTMYEFWRILLEKHLGGTLYELHRCGLASTFHIQGTPVLWLPPPDRSHLPPRPLSVDIRKVILWVKGTSCSPPREITTLDKWIRWLEGAEQPFMVWMDHTNLEDIRSAKRLNSRQARLALFFNFFYCFGFGHWR